MPRVILTDIEGTTSSINFVKDVLFPYAYAHLPAFVARHGNEAEVQRWLHATALDAGLSVSDHDGIVATLRCWIQQDRKATPLKALQGMIWAEGYRAGDYRAHVYPEVAECLRTWKAKNIALYVYSSGSVMAQKQLFGHTEAGDLNSLFSGYFDTEVGSKREVAAYARITAAIGVAPSDILFLSDILEELNAARTAGLQTTWLCRAPESCPVDAPHRCVADFNAITV